MKAKTAVDNKAKMSEENTNSLSKEAESTQTATSHENTKGRNTDLSFETDDKPKKKLPEDMYYKYEELHSRPYITPNYDIPENLLHLLHSFGYDSARKSNLKLLDDINLIIIAGNLLVILNISTKEQRYLRSCSGGGIGSIAVHPSKKHFAVAEKGNQPNIIVYEYPSLRPYRILRGGTEKAYYTVNFNHDGSLLASMGSPPDYMLTLWDWKQEEVMLSCKAISQEVYQVSFSPYNPGLLTSSGSGHIKFWRMAPTFTGLKLEGVMGHFGKTVASDIEGYVELPDGKVVSGTSWGNLLLWDGNTIKMEICCKEGKNCHNGTVQPFSIEDDQLMTFGSDGVVRVWDFGRINTANSDSDGSRFEIEPINEIVVRDKVSLSSVVKSSQAQSFVWFAQDSNGAIWKLDLSFTNTSPDPECLFSFHAGAIQSLDVSKKSHLMATTALDCLVKVFDFLAKRELTTSRFNQGGTALCWSPSLDNQSECLLVTGFQDGVVRLLELCNSQKQNDVKLRLKQALKPHDAPVTAVAYNQNGEILATGSEDHTVFFFTVGQKYSPIGFIHVPGPVVKLEWSPLSHNENSLLILCQTGHVIEVLSPEPAAQSPTKTFHLPDLPRKSFRFRSIKSRIKREEDIKRRQAEKEKKKEREEQEVDEEKEEEGELPPIYIPDPPSPLYCGFYSQPGQFWLSMGGFDSGYLYHCKFSENQEEDSDHRQDEPFDFLPVHNTDDDPICSITFSSDRQLLLCGMHSGAIRVYRLELHDHNLTSMKAYWAISLHDNQNGHLRHIRCSHDDLFVLTAGDDGNIFSLSLLPSKDSQKSLQRMTAKLPLPRVDLENEPLAKDIEDPAAYNIETARQRLESDRLRREAEAKMAAKQRKLDKLQKKFKKVLNDNQKLPEHVRLKPEELLLNQHFYEHAEKLKAQKVMEVRKQLAWEQERCSLALRKLQDWFRDSLEIPVVTVVAIRTDHRVSTYHLPTRTELPTPLRREFKSSQSNEEKSAAVERRKSKAGPATDSSKVNGRVTDLAKIKLVDRQEERLQKAVKKAEQAQAKIEKRKQEWAQIYAEKPDADCEDPEDVQAIREARENAGDFMELRRMRVNTESKTAELIGLQENIRAKQMEMNGWIVALRDSKVRLVSRLHAQVQELQQIQQRLAAHHHQPLPSVPVILPEETPEKKLQCSRSILERYRVLMEQGKTFTEQGEAVSLLEELEKEIEREKEKEEQQRGEERTPTPPAALGEELSELEEELQRREESILLYEQNSLLEQMERSVSQFDEELLLLRSQKLRLDFQVKLADLRLLTIFQEMQLLKQFERREESLQEKLNTCRKEERNIKSKLDECNEQLELRKREIGRIQEREKDLTATFQASLGENNKFEDFLTKVFKKKVKHVNKKEQTGEEVEEEDSAEDSDEDDDWDDDYDSDGEEGRAALDESVCPSGCDPKLFDNTLKLRELRLDLEEQLAEEKKISEALKRESDALAKKEKLVKSSRKAVEDDLEVINREKQQKVSELDVVVSLRLHQIEYVSNGSMPSDLSQALVLNKSELNRMQQRIKELEAEKLQQKERHRQAQQQHSKLIHERKNMTTEIQALEKQCHELMMAKFGRVVDLDAVQTMAGNKRLEELKHEKLIKEAENEEEIKEWDRKVKEARQAFMEATRVNTKNLRSMTALIEQKKELEHNLKARHKKMGRQTFQHYRSHVDQEAIQKLQELVKTQSQQAEALRREISLLSSKGGHVLPPDHARLPLLAPLPPPAGNLPHNLKH